MLLASQTRLTVGRYDTALCLRRYVRHLSMIDYCCFASTLEGRICESTTHLHEFFEDEVTFSQDERGHIRYVVSHPSHCRRPCHLFVVHLVC